MNISCFATDVPDAKLATGQVCEMERPSFHLKVDGLFHAHASAGLITKECLSSYSMFCFIVLEKCSRESAWHRWYIHDLNIIHHT